MAHGHRKETINIVDLLEKILGEASIVAEKVQDVEQKLFPKCGVVGYIIRRLILIEAPQTASDW